MRTVLAAAVDDDDETPLSALWDQQRPRCGFAHASSNSLSRLEGLVTFDLMCAFPLLRVIGSGLISSHLSEVTFAPDGPSHP